MAINPQDSITYGELLDSIQTWILNNCKNVNTYDSSVHACVKPNYSVSNVSQKWDWEYRYGADTSHAIHYRTTFVCTSASRASAVIPVVTSTQINSDLSTFLSNRNLTQRRNAIVTTSGLLNLWNNVACFLYKHLVNVTSDFLSGEKYLMYWASSPYSYATVTNMTDMNLIPNETCISALDINEMLNTLQETFNPLWRLHFVTYKQTFSDSTENLGDCTPGTYEWHGEYKPEYTMDQVLLEESNPSTFNIYLDGTAKYQIICVGAGGGGSSSYSNNDGVGGCGGSGGYSNQTVTLTAGYYTVTVGKGGTAIINENTYSSANDGGDTCFANIVASGGKGAVSDYSQEYTYGGKGGSGTTTNGNNGITNSTVNTPSVYNNYGYGGFGSTNTAGAGGNGYIKIIYKGQD